MIARALGTTLDIERGTTRGWVMASDSVERSYGSAKPVYFPIQPNLAFTVTATYRYVGKIPARKFPDDDGSVNR